MHPELFLIMRKTFQPLTFGYDTCGLLIHGLYYFQVHYAILNFLRVSVIKWFQILSNAFSESIEVIIWFSSFILLMFCITVFYLYMLSLFHKWSSKSRNMTVAHPHWQIFIILWDDLLLKCLNKNSIIYIWIN